MVESIAAFFTLSILEVLLGIDNIVVLSMLINRLKNPRKRHIAHLMGLALALLFRIIFLVVASTLMYLTKPLFFIDRHPFSIENMIVLLGGAFLINSGIKELILLFKESKNKPNESPEEKKSPKEHSLLFIIVQIGILDTIFALDSIITAIALSHHIGIIISANVLAIIAMMVLVNQVSKFLERYPSFKVLGICFVLLVALVLLLDGFSIHVPRGYLYFGILFGLFTETINALISRNKEKSSR